MLIDPTISSKDSITSYNPIFGSRESNFLDCRFTVTMYLGPADQLSGTQQHESWGMNQYHEWLHEDAAFLSLTTGNWHAFTFVAADLLVHLW